MRRFLRRFLLPGPAVRAEAGLARLRDESGVALVMALGTMLVLTIGLTSTVYMTSTSQRHAQHDNADQRAYALAEAGLNNAVAQLSSQYPSVYKQGNGGSSISSAVYTDATGTLSWSGTFNSSANRWELAAIGSVPNPAGGTDVVRTARAKVYPGILSTWSQYGLFSGDPTADCTDLKGGTSVNVAIYIASCLDIGGNTGGAEAKVYEPAPTPPITMTVHVGGTVSLSGGMTVGTAANPISWVSAGSCSPGPCGAGNGEYALSFPHKPAIPMPAVDPTAVYASANWGGASCSTGSNPFDNDSTRNSSKGTVQLFGLASFDCTARDMSNAVRGRLAWDATTKQLIVSGTVFVDGSLSVAPGQAGQYTGDGTIYLNGSVDIKGTVCGPGSSFDSSTGACGMTWDPAQGGVMFVAANAGSLVAGSPLLTYADPNADGVSPNNAWTKSAGTSGWSLLDDAVRQPTAPTTGTDRVTSSTDEQTQELVFPNTLLYDATSTYTLRIYGSAGSKRALDVQVSTNDGASWQTRQANVIGAGSGSSWRSIDVTSLAASQAALDGLRVRLICNQTATGGGAGSVEVDEVYVDGSLPTWTTSLVDPAFGVNSGAKFEAGAWAVGNFASTGTAELGGSVYVQDGTAKIAGGGSLKAFLSLPSGAPELYSIENGATEFG